MLDFQYMIKQDGIEHFFQIIWLENVLEVILVENMVVQMGMNVMEMLED